MQRTSASSNNSNNLTIGDAMARIVPTVRIDSTVCEADLERLFGGRRFVPVLNPNRRVLGLASCEELRAAIEAGGGEASPRSVLLLGVPLLRADASATQAAAQLRASRVDLLPVVDDDRRFIGAVSAEQLELREQLADADELEQFARCLHGLEVEAVNGLVPGEMRRWCAHVADRMAELGARWARRQRDRFEMLDRIRDLDAALHSRADELSAAEVDLRDRFGTLSTVIGRSATSTEALVPDDVDRMRTDLLHWIADVRAHDGALTTWYNEALLRDRGVGD